ncbi:MAG: hypothetical protein H6698_08830 [Myxococcales bacterium]|nr:hypothetical protein [Myxococcales bacterium]MCB9534389.1 hypothetical protein [Myxococcales bacterium]
MRYAASLLGMVLALGACGGAPPAPVAAPAAADPPCCIDARWAQPPSEIGATPPEAAAPVGATDAFGPPAE